MNLKDMIQKLKKDVKRNRVIIINKNNIEYLNEFKKLDMDPINLSYQLSKLVDGLSDKEKRNEGKDILENFLNGLNQDIIVLDEIDYVFSQEIGNLEIISFLNYFTRNGKIVILFLDARKEDNKLIYSKEYSDDYKSMDISQNEFVLGWDNEN
jgi:archaellum biogenesis ATPase FlaH